MFQGIEASRIVVRPWMHAHVSIFGVCAALIGFLRESDSEDDGSCLDVLHPVFLAVCLPNTVSKPCATVFDEQQGPHERSFIEIKFYDEWLFWHHKTNKNALFFFFFF